MDKPKFTPGPWRIGFADGSGKNEDNDGYWITNHEDAVVVMSERHGCVVGIDDIDNANFIAAAPDMYEALQKANVFITNGMAFGYIKMPDLECGDAAWETLDLIKAVLAKARGESHG